MVRWSRLIPGPGETVFSLVLVFVLVGGRYALFNDPGTLWHLRLGRDILASGSVPRSDSLTFTRSDAPWVDQSWGFDVLLALVVDQGGWTWVVALTVLLLATLYGAMAQGLVANGISPPIAVLVSLMMAAIGCIHFLIRPHLLTLAFAFVAFRICQKQHEEGGWSVFWISLMTAVLANVHGGFVALPIIVLSAGVGHAFSGSWNSARVMNLMKFVLALAASLLAGLATPYGWGLYRHVGNLLVGSGVTRLIQEYQPAPFGEPEARVLEMVLLSLMALPALVSRRLDRYHLVHLLVWLHLALTSIRNAPLFALAAAYPLASLLDGLPHTFRGEWPGRLGRSWWVAGLAALTCVLAISGVNLGRFNPAQWPFSALTELNRQPLSSHLFHEQDWGGLIAAECCPPRRSYLDDRFELFGKETILEYAEALAGGPAWDTIRDREAIRLVWLKPDRGLTKRLMNDPGWKVLHHDGLSVLVERVSGRPLEVTSSLARP